jgi:hypothetical protein
MGVPFHLISPFVKPITAIRLNFPNRRRAAYGRPYADWLSIRIVFQDVAQELADPDEDVRSEI